MFSLLPDHRLSLAVLLSPFRFSFLSLHRGTRSCARPLRPISDRVKQTATGSHLYRDNSCNFGGPRPARFDGCAAYAYVRVFRLQMRRCLIASSRDRDLLLDPALVRVRKEGVDLPIYLQRKGTMFKNVITIFYVQLRLLSCGVFYTIYSKLHDLFLHDFLIHSTPSPSIGSPRYALFLLLCFICSYFSLRF